MSGTRAASALAAGAVAVIRSRYPAMPWYRVIQRLTGTALPEGGQVPNDSFGYGIFRLSHAVNAAAYPVAASAPNPVYAKYQAWLASPQGQSVSRQLSGSASRSAAAAAAPASGDGSATVVLIAVLAPLAAAGAVAAALAVRMRLRPIPRKPRHGRRRKRPSGATFPDPAYEPEEYLRDPDLPDDDPPGVYQLLGERMPYRIPPYSPAPDPHSFPSRTNLLDGPPRESRRL